MQYVSCLLPAFHLAHYHKSNHVVCANNIVSNIVLSGGHWHQLCLRIYADEIETKPPNSTRSNFHQIPTVPETI